MPTFAELGLPTAVESAALTERIGYWDEPGADGARYYGGQAALIAYEVPAGGAGRPAALSWG